jgi:hypothetical protein
MVGLGTLWVIFSQTHLVTLIAVVISQACRNASAEQNQPFSELLLEAKKHLDED